jgi:hypothetical protein
VCAEQRVVQEGSSPSDARMRSVISEGGGSASPAEQNGGMEKPMRARRRKPDTDKVDLEPLFRESGGQGVHREVGSEGHEEKYRAVIDGGHPEMNRSAKGGTRSSPHYRGEGALIHPPYQGVCGRHGMEEQHVTSGGLTSFAGGTAISGPISASEMGSDVMLVVGLPE